MPKRLSLFASHVERWKNGCGSDQCDPKKKKVVLARGSLPCDVLFVGEAPGESENVLGVPFAGPAGRLLDQIIQASLGGVETTYPDSTHDTRPLRVAFTNVVCCIPRDPENPLEKWTEPEDEQIESCRDRLEEFIGKVAKPRLVVMVGKVAEHWLTQGYKHSIKIPETCKTVAITHPAAILRAPTVQRDFAVQRCVVTLSNAVEDL